MDSQKMTVGGREMYAKLAKVTDAWCGLNERGFFDCWVFLDYGGSAQGFGGYCLSRYDKAKDRQVGTACGLDYVLGILRAFGASKVEDLKGRFAYALFEDDSWNSMVKGLMTTPQEGGKHFLTSEWREEWNLTS
jgi:hypothetical protein